MDFVKLTLSAVSKRLTFSQCRVENYDKRLNIGMGADSSYIRPMAVTITSLAVNNPALLLNFYIFLGSIEDNDLPRLEELTKQYPNIIINFYDVDQQKFDLLPTHGWFSVATYFRMMMPIVLHELDNILYLDSDIICLKDIEEIINIDMGGKIAAVVLDCENIGNEQAGKLNLPFGEYFNAGVMIIDIKKWNNQVVSENALKILIKSPEKFYFLDQDVLNITLKDAVKYLPPKWNYMHGRKNKNDIPADTIFLHCAAHPKPWRCACSDKSKVQPYYLKYEELSPWKQTPLELPTNYNDARRYSRLLFRNGKILEAVKWFVKYRKMKRDEKLNL